MVSSIVANWEAHKPDHMQNLVMKHNGYIPFIQQTMDMGMKRTVSSGTYYHHEDYAPDQFIVVDATVVDAGAGNDLVIVLDTLSLDSSNAYFPQKGDQIRMNNGNTGIVSNIVVSGATVTVTISPNLSTATLGGVTALDKLSIVSNSYAEYTRQPSPRVTPTARFTNYTHITKTTIAASGSELTNEKWYRVPEGRGADNGNAFSLQTLAGEIRHMKKLSGGMLYSQNTTNTIVDVTAETTYNHQTTNGLFPELSAKAIPISTTTNTYDITDLVDISEGMDRQYCFDTSIVSYLGHYRYYPMETAFSTQFQDANTSAVRRMFNSQLGIESLEATMNFKMLTRCGKSWGFNILNELRDPAMSNHSSSITPDYGIYAGTGKVRDSKTKKLYSKICAVTKGLGAYSRKMEVWFDGTAGPGVKIGDLDGRLKYWRSEYGFEGFALNQCAFQTA